MQHHAFMNRHLPARIYLIREETRGMMDRPDEPYATYCRVSQDLTKYRFSFNGKTDYKDAASLYRDMYFFIYNSPPPISKKSKQGERRDRGNLLYDYRSVFIQY
jgi:hypothetical protein